MIPALLRVARWLALVLVSMVCGGCGEHLLGTHDIELDYEVRQTTGADVKETVAETARNPILRRLGAAQITADVEATSANHVKITVDEGSAETVDEMLAWRGGVAVYRLDGSYGYTPKDLAGLTAKFTTAADGTVERHYVGSRSAVIRAVNAGTIDADHRVLVEWVNVDTARTRVVKLPALVDLKSAVSTVLAEDATILVNLSPGDTGSQALAKTITDVGGEPVSIALGRTVIAVEPLRSVTTEAADRLTLKLDKDIYGYARARGMMKLLETRVTPPLARTGAVSLPTNYPLAVACVLLPLLLSLGWLFFVRRFDRSHPEPWWLVLATFALGGLSVIPAALAELGLQSASPYLNPSLMTLGGQLVAFPLALGVFTFVVGMSEEGSKFLAAWALASHRREFDEPVDGIIYGAASALGFAAVENIKYFAVGRLSPTLVVLRTFTSIPAHMFFGAIWGYALGKKLISKKTSVLLYLAWAALMHGAFDTVLSIDGLQLAALGVNLTLATIFVVLLRKALRHGRITPEMDGAPASSRMFFTVGSVGMFVAAAIAVHVLAASVVLVSAYAQGMHMRVGVWLMSVSSVLCALLGLSAWWVSATLPLDVAVDDYGVTFAGTARPWSTISHFEVRPYGRAALVKLYSSEGDLTLGPGAPDIVANLARALAARRVGAT